MYIYIRTHTHAPLPRVHPSVRGVFVFETDRLFGSEDTRARL